MTGRLVARVNRHFAQRAYAAASRSVGQIGAGIAAGPGGLRPSLVLAQVLSLLVLATPLCVIGAGLWLILANHPSAMGYVYGLPLVGLGWALLPRRGRVPKGALGRADAPASFALIDRIGDAIGAPRVDYLVPSPEINAYAMDVRRLGRPRVRVLGLGLPLWQAIDDAGRVALIGHELGHFVNGDPGRAALPALALDTLGR